MTNIAESVLNRSPRSHSQFKSESTSTTIYSFAIILQPLAESKETLCLTAYFKEPPFRFEIDEWALSQVGSNYQVADSFPLEEINL